MGRTTSHVPHTVDLPGSRPMRNAQGPIIELVAHFVKGIFIKEIMYHYLSGY